MRPAEMEQRQIYSCPINQSQACHPRSISNMMHLKTL
uniref:Uncharacterized protein n=1 Tax=Rhizophora mucronata TaxID=61149 RepID=A0A2P2NAZ1_RHIMU